MTYVMIIYVFVSFGIYIMVLAYIVFLVLLVNVHGLPPLTHVVMH